MKKDKKKRLKRLTRRAVERRLERNEKKRIEATGTIRVSSYGYGFIKIAENDPMRDKLGEKGEVFVPGQFVHDALDGDTVRFNFTPAEDTSDSEHGPVGRVLEVIERKRETFIGEIVAGRKLRPMNRRIPQDIQLGGSLRGSVNGDWVRVKVLPNSERGGEKRMAMVVERIGQAGLIAADLDAVCAEYDLAPPYTEEQDQEASLLVPREIERRDLRKMPTVTIDPIDAKDFDDAISIQKGSSPNEIIIGVHISDVAAYIAPGSPFDKRSAARGFTAYLPGRTLPMLPKTLTAAISLQEGRDTLAHSVLFTVSVETGEIIAVERCHSVINVDSRLTYSEVQEFFDNGTKPPRLSQKLADDVMTALKIARIWRKDRKQKEKFIELAMPEIRILCDESTNKILGLASKVQRESEELIEEYMLAANSAVAEELNAKKLPGLFRVHSAPDPEKLAEFSALATETFGLSVGDLTNRDVCNKFIESIADGPLKPIILNAFLRSLPRAAYLAEPALHFGLGKTLYSHFTSPIRRYTDLAVHQQLWCMDTNTKWKPKSVMASVAESCSELEMNNDSAYYAANDRLKLRYLDELLGKKRELNYTGIVRKTTAAGLLVDVAELGIYGFVPLAALGHGYRQRNDRLESRSSRQHYQAGDLIQLTLAHIDFAKQSAVFELNEAKNSQS